MKHPAVLKKIFDGFLLFGASFTHAQVQPPSPPIPINNKDDLIQSVYTLQGKLGGVESKGADCQIMARAPGNPHDGKWYRANPSFCQHARTAYILNTDVGLYLRDSPGGWGLYYQGFWIHQP